MKWQDIFLADFDQIRSTLERVIDGLSDADLNWQPAPDSNSIGWLAWHLSRGQDALMTPLIGGEQLWIKDKWYVKCGRQAEARDTGTGHSVQDLANFKTPDIKLLLDYHKAVNERTKKYILGLSEADPDKPLKDSHFQPPTFGMQIAIALSDGLQHAGQAGYVRGLRQGKGWQKF